MRGRAVTGGPEWFSARGRRRFSVIQIAAGTASAAGL